MLMPGDERRILHVISGIDTGGAETALLRLTTHLDPRYHSTVLALRDGTMRERFVAQGVTVVDGGLTRFTRLPATLRKISRVTRATRPHVIHGWMNHGNLAAWRARQVAGRGSKLVWGIRQSLYALEYEKPATRWVIRAEAALSRAPDVILFNSVCAVAQHRAHGFDNPRLEVIPNGFDTARFHADPQARTATRRELGIPPDGALIGFVGRNHPMKDLPTFLAAMARVLRQRADAWVLAVGSNVPALRAGLAERVGAELVPRVVLADENGHMERIYPALDVLCSTSLHGEGFPNVVAEAMACEVPCVVTDVGDAASIVADTGRVVARSDAAACAAAVLALLDADLAARAALGARARRRVIEHFSMESMVARHAAVYDSLLAEA